MTTARKILSAAFLFCSILTRAQFTYTNEICSGAIPLTVNNSSEFTNGVYQWLDYADATNTGTTNCASVNTFRDLWYSFVATHTTHYIKTKWSVVPFQVFSGTCGALNSISCGGPLTGLTVGDTYYVRTYSFSAAATVNDGIYDIFVYSDPENDDCNNATPLAVATDNSISARRKFTTAYATTGTCWTSTYKDTWFSFVATAPKLSVYFTATDLARWAIASGTPDDLTFITTSPSTTQGDNIPLTNLTVGDTYYIGVGNTTTFDFELAVLTPFANDDCVNAETIFMSETDNCDSYTIVNRVGYTNQDIGCTAASQNAWYKFEATATDVLIRKTMATTGNLVLMDGDCSGFTCLEQANSDPLTYSGLEIGSTYYLEVAGVTLSSTGICVSRLPQNDECVDAVEIPVNDYDDYSITMGNNFGATSSLPQCSSAGSTHDLWYKFTAQDTACIIQVKCIPTYPKFDVLSGTCGSLTSIFCATNDGDYRVGDLIIGEVYFVRVYNSDEGEFTIGVWDIPANDECEGAVHLNPQDVLLFEGYESNFIDRATQSEVPCTATPYVKDLWYTFSPDATSAAIISHSKSSDVFYQVYSGSCASLTNVTCISQGAVYHKAYTLTSLQAGSNYFIRQFGSSPNTSLVVLAPPANDEITGATEVHTVPSAVTNIPSYTLHGASKSFGKICTASAPQPLHDVWFHFTAEAASHEVKTADLNTFWDENYGGPTYRIEAFDGYAADSAGLAPLLIGCAANTLSLSGLTVGDEIYLRVYNINALGATTNFALSVSNGQDMNEPEGAAILHLVNDYELALSTQGATLSLPSANCLNTDFSDDDIWMKFQFEAGMKRVIAGYETKMVTLELFSGTPGNLVSMQCSGNIMILPNSLSAGTEYYLRAYSKADAQVAQFQLGIYGEDDMFDASCIDLSCAGPNLVANPRCESEYEIMPPADVVQHNDVDAQLAEDWWNASWATADFVSSDYPLGVYGKLPEWHNSPLLPYDKIPRSGKGMFGILIYGGWSEYITGKLSTPLTPGKSYMLSFQASVDEAQGVREFFQVGALLTEKKFQSGEDDGIELIPHVSNTGKEPLTSTNTWTTICGIVTVDKPYEYITIGNWRNENGFGTTGNGYIFIDDVVVSEVLPPCITTEVEEEPSTKQDDPKNYLTVYPNPANEAITVVINQQVLRENCEVLIRDLSGRTAWRCGRSQINSGKVVIDTQALPAGFYYVTIKTGSMQLSEKLMIVR